jgi:hypothetical protein
MVKEEWDSETKQLLKQGVGMIKSLLYRAIIDDVSMKEGMHRPLHGEGGRGKKENIVDSENMSHPCHSDCTVFSFHQFCINIARIPGLVLSAWFVSL